jgi:NADPH2:quinone reductase
MKAAVLTNYGETPHYGDFDEPRASDGGRVVDVVLAAMNPSDISRTLGPGRFFMPSPALPHVVGREGVGRLGDGSLAYFGMVEWPFGAFAERCVALPQTLMKLPEGLDPAQAVAFGTSGTGWLALEWRGRVEAGETVLVLGASGTVGEIAVQAAKLLGAGRVVAVGRSADGLERAARRGADATVRIGGVEDLGQAVAEACEGGFDLALDPLWGEPLAQVLGAAKRDARIVQIGQSAGAAVSLPSGPIRGKMLSILGHTNGNVPAELRERALRTMFEHAAAGRLEVEVERLPLSEVASAWERQKRSPGAKLVLVP